MCHTQFTALAQKADAYIHIVYEERRCLGNTMVQIFRRGSLSLWVQPGNHVVPGRRRNWHVKIRREICSTSRCGTDHTCCRCVQHSIQEGAQANGALLNTTCHQLCPRPLKHETTAHAVWIRGSTSSLNSIWRLGA